MGYYLDWSLDVGILLNIKFKDPQSYTGFWFAVCRFKPVGLNVEELMAVILHACYHIPFLLHTINIFIILPVSFIFIYSFPTEV